jgi:glutamine amidotransferase
MITIVDYGMGNLASIKNMLKKIGHSSTISSEIEQIKAATKLILPGVGSYDSGMKNLHERKLIDVLNKKVLDDKTPVLGICLGMQLLANHSEEGAEKGLGWINADVIRFRQELASEKLHIPHMGWNFVNWSKRTALVSEIPLPSRFYFVHSYHISNVPLEWVLGETTHGYSFVSAVEKDNIIGVQYHPEKSHKYGMALLKNFAEKY